MNHCPACRREFPLSAGSEAPYCCPHCHAKVLGPYCHLAWIGGGGMGDVYRAVEPGMGNRTVAIKVPKTDFDVQRALRRFEREIAASARLQHENVVRAYHRSQEGERHYLVMEFVAGQKLSDVVRRQHPLSPRRVARVLLGIARGLAHAAKRGVINRDIKPENIILAEPDETPKILDYGLALIVDMEEQVTRFGSLLGTPNYTAPEQYRDPHAVDIAADVYSLGCTAFFCLTRRPPFSPGDFEETYRQHSQSPRPSVRKERPDVPEAFDALVQRMMSPVARDRPSPERLIEELQRWAACLSDERPWSGSEQGATMTDVTCPECGIVYHFGPELMSSRVRCPNKTCGAVFVPRERLAAQAGTVEVLDSQPVGPGPPEEGHGAAAKADAAHMADTVALDFAALVRDFDLPADVPSPAEEGDSPSATPLPVVAAFPASNEGTPLSPAPIETVDALPVFDEQGPRPGRAPPALVAAFPAEGPPPSVAAAPGEVPVVLAALPAEAVDTPGQAAASSRDEAPSQPASPALAAQSRRARRKRPINKLKLAVSLLGVVLAVGFGYWFFGPPPPSKDPDWRWANCKKLYDERKWAAAIREFKRFEPDFPDDPRVAQIPFFLAMCDAGDDVYGDPGNPERGLKTAQDVFRDHRDNSAYQDYCIDLYQALAHLIEARFLKPTDAGVEPEQVTRAEEAFGLLKTVNEAIKEPWVAERTGKLDALIAEGRKGSANLVATRKAKNLIEDLQGRKPGLDPDKVYRDLERLLATHPDLRQGRDLRDRLTEVYKSEPAQVRFEREDPANQPPPERGPADDSGRQGNTLVIAWGKPARGAATVPAGDVVLALARGILYAFDAQGKLCWARRLGVDSTRLPERIAPGRELQAGLVAVDSENNTLLALDPASGEPRWRYRVGSDIVAPLTIVPRQALPNAPKRLFGLLPTAEGEIHVVELVLGKRLGRFAVGQPMTVGGTYDPATELAFFPADAQRIFAIDPAAIDHPGDPKHPGCRFIVFTGHSSGAVRSEPMIVGQYLLVAEATELEHTRLRAFELRGKDFPLPAADPAKNGLFPRPSSADLKQQRLRGWAWFAPHATPDRITLVTDHGDLGVFGLNLDNPDEAIYSIVQVAPDQAAVPMFRREPFRNLVIAAEEHLLWVMADGRLQKLSLDIVHQQVKSLWAKDDPEIGVRGIPIHEAQADRRGEVFYLATMSPSGQVYHLTAVDAETGRRQWQRQLGLNILGDPLVYEDYVVLVDQAGRTLAQQPRPGFVHSRLPRKVLLPGEQGLPPGADDASPMCLGEPPGPVHLAVTLDQGRKVAVRPVRIPFGDDEPWQEVTLHGQLQGRPCVCSGFLVAPCSDGQLYRFPLGPGSVLGRNEVSFTWAEFKTPGADTAQVYSMGPDTVLLVDGARRIRRLQLRTEGDVTEWKEVGTAFYSTSPLTAQPLTLGQDIYVCDSEGTLLRLDATNPVRCLRRWPLGAQVTAGPVLRKDRLLLVLEGRKLMWIDPDAARPCWTSKPLPGRIVGMPSRAGNTLLVADTSRRLTGLSVDSGEKLWSEPLGVRVGPAAAAVPYGAEKVLVPLVDGSVLVLPIAAETGPPSARLANKPGN